MKPGKPARRAAPRGAGRARRSSGGFTYFGVLFLVMLIGLALTGALELWSTASQRARERDLLWVGNQYARALQSYYQHSPGPKQYPQSLDQLLDDRRFPVTRRHLRKLYADPITGDTQWGFVLSPDGRIVGVHSLSEDEPRKKAEFPRRWEDFNQRQKYSEWRFVADVGLLGKAAPAKGVIAAPATPPVVAH